MSVPSGTRDGRPLTGCEGGTVTFDNSLAMASHRPTVVTQWLTADGRVNRARYFGRILLLAGAIFAAALILGALLGISAAGSGQGADPGAIQALVLILQLLSIWPSVCLVVKRLHDLGRPGTHYWLLFVPFYNLYLACLILF